MDGWLKIFLESILKIILVNISKIAELNLLLFNTRTSLLIVIG